MSTILSGIRASGQLHIGSYLGAIKQWIELQEKNTAFFMVADLHAITTPYVAPNLAQQVRETILDYLAAGLDPKQATIFVQSHVPAHSELMWLLNTITPIGELQRMVQFKEKSAAHDDYQHAGILNYPILMAADILIYKADRVPVGEDQVQHIELARDLARKFNRMFGQTFPEPQPLLSRGRRIMSLTDPFSKMSKTGGDGIGLTDSPTDIEHKLKSAVTSSEPKVIRDAFNAALNDTKDETAWRGDPKLHKQFCGVRNLFTLLLVFGTKKDIATWKSEAEAGTVQFSKFKPTLAKLITDHFADFRTRRTELVTHPEKVNRIIDQGAKQASEVANATLLEVQQKMGLR